jgi:hypothetical protein
MDEPYRPRCLGRQSNAWSRAAQGAASAGDNQPLPRTRSSPGCQVDGTAGLLSAPEMPCALSQLRLVPGADVRRAFPKPRQSTLSRPSLRSTTTAGHARFCSLMGQGTAARLWAISTLSGCLRSLRAHVALDGVSWVQSGSVEIAVAKTTACYRIGAVICSLPRAPLRSGARFDLLLKSQSLAARH